jgi:hypothetical protein
MHQIRRSLRRALFRWCLSQAQATTNFPHKHFASDIKSVAQINDGAGGAEADESADPAAHPSTKTTLLPPISLLPLDHQRTEKALLKQRLFRLLKLDTVTHTVKIFCCCFYSTISSIQKIALSVAIDSSRIDHLRRT